MLDFGIARLLHRTATGMRTGTGALLGTPAYMSPEQCEGKPVDGRSNLYALGLIVYELVAGALPFPPSPSVRRCSWPTSRSSRPNLAGRAPAAPPALVRLVMSMLAKDPAARPADADAVIAALERLPGATRDTGPAAGADLATGPTLAPSASVAPASAASGAAAPRRGGLAVALLLGVALVVGTWGVLSKPRPGAGASGPVAAPSDEPPLPAACDPALAGKLAEARHPGLADAEAADRLEAIVAACPSSAVARALLGTALTRLDRDAEAEPHLRAALLIAPDYASARHNLAVLLIGEASQPRRCRCWTPCWRATRATRRRGSCARRRGSPPATRRAPSPICAPRRSAGRTMARAGRCWARHWPGRATPRGRREAACRAVALGVATARERCGAGPTAPAAR